MKEEINIAEILKDKPKGTKLYSLTYGDCFYQEYTGDFGIECNSQSGVQFNLEEHGRYCIEGECIIFPSKEMCDWSKFAWKKGDVLVSNDGEETIFFDRFTDDTYTKFVGKYVWGEGVPAYRRFSEKEETLFTKNYSLEENKENIKKHILTVEACILKAGLNLETLETIPLKDGDIYFCKTYRAIKIGIFKSLYEDHNEVYISNYVYYHANVSTPYLDYSNDDWVDDGIYRPATNEEKQQLFAAIEKEGKHWNAEKKVVEDIKKEYQFKPFEKVLARDSKDSLWHIDLYEGMLGDDNEYNYSCMAADWVYCIPYEGNEHLLGTTKDVEEDYEGNQE